MQQWLISYKDGSKYKDRFAFWFFSIADHNFLSSFKICVWSINKLMLCFTKAGNFLHFMKTHGHFKGIYKFDNRIFASKASWLTPSPPLLFLPPFLHTMTHQLMNFNQQKWYTYLIWLNLQKSNSPFLTYIVFFMLSKIFIHCIFIPSTTKKH